MTEAKHIPFPYNGSEGENNAGLVPLKGLLLTLH